MEDVALFQQAEGEEQLLAVGPDSLDMQSNILSVLFEDLPQIHREGLKHHAQVLLVEEVSEETYAVVAIFWICVVQFLQNLKFLESGLVPATNRRAHQRHLINKKRGIKLI
jgi:hypothetical protein